MGILNFGEVYRYARPYDATKPESDGLKNYFYLVKTPGKNLPTLDKGINRIAPIQTAEGSRCPAILLSSSPHKIGSHDTPWNDSFDSDRGHIKYYGDNKSNDKLPEKPQGNAALLEQFTLHSSPDRKIRERSAPILFFRRVPYGNKQKGYVQFHGVGVITNVELVTQYHAKGDEYFANYVFDFAVLDISTEGERFNWDWISARRDESKSLAKILPLAPRSWKEWIKGGYAVLNKSRRQVSKLFVEKTNSQKLDDKSEDARVLKDIYEYYDNCKHRFEAVASEVTANVVESNGAIYRRGWVTRGSSDGGADFIGRIDVGKGLASAKLIVLGQAKCERLDAVTGGNHIARTVARLRRGWLGAYVTTSYFSEAVQREVIDDEYPIMLINGRTVAEVIRKMTYDGGYSSHMDLIKDIDSRYESMLQNRRPEEILII